MKNSNLFQMDSGENDFAQACAEWYSQGESQRNSGARNWKADTKLCFALEGLSCTLFCMPFTQMLFLQGGQFGSLQVVYGGSELDWRNLWRWDMEEILGWAFEIIDKGRRQRNPKKSSWIPDSKLVQDGAKTTVRFSSVQSLSHVWLFVTPWIAARQASLSIINSRSLPKPMPIESVIPSSHLILRRPLLLLPPIPASIRVFSNESALRMRWPKYWSFSFSISPFNEHPGLVSFRMDWLHLLAVQGTLKSLFQHHSSKALILWCSAFFRVQLSHPYMIAGKAIALTRQTFLAK